MAAASNQALADALAALTQVLQGLQAAQAAQPAIVAPPLQAPPMIAPVLDPFQATTPFDLASRAGSHAYATACSTLDTKWDGTITKFPSFLLALRVRGSEVNWDAPAPQGILTFAVQGVDRNLFSDHYAISETEIETARAARTDNRAIQNSRSLYKCLKNSIEGDLRTTLFDQGGNLLAHEDGPTLFKQLTSFTMAASLQLSMLSFQQILDFDPAEHAFVIPTINTKLSHLFVLATMRERSLSQTERIQHTITVYARIKQPEVWAQWTRNQVDTFEAGALLDCQAFMNSATLKYTKVCSENNGFEGSVSTVQEDIVAMLASTKKAKSSAGTVPEHNNDNPGQARSGEQKKFPPFVKHFKTGTGDNAANFKLGDKKEWNSATWYYCDCPTHRDRHKWHTHTHDKCRTRKKWLADGGTSRNPPAIAQITDVPSDESAALTSATGVTSRTNASSSASSDITSMLAAALSLAGGNATAQAAIADALNAIHDT